MSEMHRCDWFTNGHGGRRGRQCSRWADEEFAGMWACAQHLRVIADFVRSAINGGLDGGRRDVPAIRAAATAGLREFRECEYERKRERDERERKERRWDPDGPSVVYYLQRGDGMIKIGVSTQYRTRKQTLEREHGPLTLLVKHWGDRRTEGEMHDKFRDDNVTGEWFRPSPALLRWIDRIRRHQAEQTQGTEAA